MPTVYAISSGSYSDYQVHAVFSTRQLAEAAAAAANGDPDRWSTYDVESISYYDAEPADGWLSTTYQASCEVYDDGTTKPQRDFTRTYPLFDRLYTNAGPRPAVRFVRAPIHQDRGGRLEVYGTDEQAVQQAFSDTRARLIVTAEQTGKATL